MRMSEQRPYIFDPSSIGFYITSSDQDLLVQVRKHLQKTGYLAVSDTAGRLHYIMDGTRGVPFAARRILETAERYVCESEADKKKAGRFLPEAIEQVLDQNGIRTELKGRAFLREILKSAAKDERQLNPTCKALYPEAARHFHVSANQVERDIRYAVLCAKNECQWPESLGSGNSACIGYLCSEVQRTLRRLVLKADGSLIPGNESADQSGKPS